MVRVPVPAASHPCGQWLGLPCPIVSQSLQREERRYPPAGPPEGHKAWVLRTRQQKAGPARGLPITLQGPARVIPGAAYPEGRGNSASSPPPPEYSQCPARSPPINKHPGTQPAHRPTINRATSSRRHARPGLQTEAGAGASRLPLWPLASVPTGPRASVSPSVKWQRRRRTRGDG